MNFGNNDYKDFEFLKSDYVKKVGRETTYPLKWRWRSDTRLSFDITTDTAAEARPSTIKVRSYESGGSATLIVEVTKKGLRPQELRVSVPFDENKNGIADKWEKDNDIYLADIDDAQAKAKLDDETIQRLFGQNYADPWQGDGWVIADEYRGLFLEKTDNTLTRLDPKKKEVMVCPEDTNETKDMWSYGTGSIHAPEHDYHQIHQDFVKRRFDNSEGFFVWKKADIGWVNFNSTRKRAYAIRIVRDRIHPDGNHIPGRAPDGAPGPHSIVSIYYDGIENKLAQDLKLKRDTPKMQAAIDVVVSTTISHEIGHCLNCDHCSEPGCIMLSSQNPTDYYRWDGQKFVPQRTEFKHHQTNQHFLL